MQSKKTRTNQTKRNSICLNCKMNFHNLTKIESKPKELKDPNMRVTCFCLSRPHLYKTETVDRRGEGLVICVCSIRANGARPAHNRDFSINRSKDEVFECPWPLTARALLLVDRNEPISYTDVARLVHTATERIPIRLRCPCELDWPSLIGDFSRVSRVLQFSLGVARGMDVDRLGIFLVASTKRVLIFIQGGFVRIQVNRGDLDGRFRFSRGLFVHNT